MMNDTNNRYPIGRVLNPLKKIAVVPLLCLTMLACQSVPQANANLSDTGKELLKTTKVAVQNVISFIDVVGHWALESIKTAVQKGYVEGYEDLSFKPDKSVTRAEFVKMVVTGLKIPVNGNVSGSEWYLPYVNAAVNAGLHRWSDFNSGDWNTPITRQEMSRMVVRATDKELQNANVVKSDAELMYLATKAGLIQGLSGGVLGEQEVTTRAQSVTVIERILTVNAGSKLEVDKYAVNRAELAWLKTNIFTVMPEFFGTLFPKTTWDPSIMFVETPDGYYRGEMDAIIAIDLDDPNDPHRHLVDIANLKWLNVTRSKIYPVSELTNAYLLYFNGRQVYNYNTDLYGNIDYMFFGVTGILPNSNESREGRFGGLAATSRIDFMNGQFPALVIGKNVNTSDSLFIDIKSSAIAPNPTYSKTLLHSKPSNE